MESERPVRPKERPDTGWVSRVFSGVSFRGPSLPCYLGDLQPLPPPNLGTYLKIKGTNVNFALRIFLEMAQSFLFSLSL